MEIRFKQVIKAVFISCGNLVGKAGQKSVYPQKYLAFFGENPNFTQFLKFVKQLIRV